MFDNLFGVELPLPAKFFIAFLVVLGLIGATAWLVRRFGADRLGGGTARGRQPRLAVIDAASVDSRRRLVLIRRDNIEHLIMIGGPTDVVVEPNIVRATGAREPALREPPPMREPIPREAPMRAPEAAVRPLEGSSWPLQPEPPVAPAPATRPHRGALTDEPWLQTEPGARPRPVPDNTLSGLAAELSGKFTPEPKTSPHPEMKAPPARPTPEPRIPEPRIAEPRVAEPRIAEPRVAEARMPESRPSEPRVSEPRFSEPRIGEPGIPEPMPATEPARAVGPPLRVSEPKISEPRLPEAPRVPEPSVRATEPPRAPEPAAPSPAEQAADQNLAEMAQRLEAALRRPLGGTEPPRSDVTARPPATDPLAVPPVRSEPRATPSAAPKPARPETKPEAKPAPDAPAADSKPAASKNLYDNLEAEMANLLGRPTNKA
ncbi:MAG TPA: flagellar biosynthetic protein FliO [Pseudolabrys sp.]|nr:flagellar biosynthetic protein FliO [Pseudolabrys sp.]